MVIDLPNGYTIRCVNCGNTLAHYNLTPAENLQELWLKADHAGYKLTTTGARCSYCV